MGVLGRGVNNRVTRSHFDLNDEPARFHRLVRNAMLMKTMRNDAIRACERSIDFAVVLGVVEHDVGFGMVPDRGTAAVERVANIRDWCKHVVVDFDEFARVFGNLARNCHDDGDRVADVSHAIVRERIEARVVEARDTEHAHERIRERGHSLAGNDLGDSRNF